MLREKTIFIENELKKAIGLFSGREKGALITYEEFEEATGLKYGSKPFTTLMTRFKSAMKRPERNKSCKPVNGIGLRFLTDEEALTKEADKIEKSAERKLKKAAEMIGMVSPDDVTAEQRQLQKARLRQLAYATKVSKTHEAERVSWLSNPKTLPKIPKQD